MSFRLRLAVHLEWRSHHRLTANNNSRRRNQASKSSSLAQSSARNHPRSMNPSVNIPTRSTSRGSLRSLLLSRSWPRGAHRADFAKIRAVREFSKIKATLSIPLQSRFMAKMGRRPILKTSKDCLSPNPWRCSSKLTLGSRA